MLNQTYKELAIPYFKEVFNIIDEVLTKRNIPYYLVGVSAIALELLQDGKKPSRGTKDIDFAIMISSLEDFENVVTDLEHFGFNKVKAPWTVYHPKYNIAIDLLPFGEIEENYTINFNERFTDLHVLGFKEVLEETNEIRIEEKIAKIPSLHGMILLKLVAWADRPEERPNDPYDILRIIEYYYLYNLNEILDNHYDIFPEDNFDQLKISARVLGRKAAHILQKSEKLSARIFTILNENKMNPVKSSFVRQWVQQKDWTFEYAVEILNEFETGLKENINQ
jgi:predicted nucleotidyltransferase